VTPITFALVRVAGFGDTAANRYFASALGSKLTSGLSAYPDRRATLCGMASFERVISNLALALIAIAVSGFIVWLLEQQSWLDP
jgi:hypothetical protein